MIMTFSSDWKFTENSKDFENIDAKPLGGISRCLEKSRSETLRRTYILSHVPKILVAHRKKKLILFPVPASEIIERNVECVYLRSMHA